jgi:hypothetical protein
MESFSRRDLLRGLGVSVVAAAIPVGVAQAAGPKGYASTRLVLHGDWHRARITGTIAFGDGHEGTDIWSDLQVAVPPVAVLAARYSNILYDDRQGFYYFVYELEVGQTSSTEIAAIFRYHKDHDEGVFAAAFQWNFDQT